MLSDDLKQNYDPFNALKLNNFVATFSVIRFDHTFFLNKNHKMKKLSTLYGTFCLSVCSK